MANGSGKVAILLQAHSPDQRRGNAQAVKD